MISIHTAFEILDKNIFPCPEEIVSLYESLNRVASEDIRSPIEVPSFDNSAMDGYAFRIQNLEKFQKLKVKDEVQAGVASLPELEEGTAIRILTGAPIPKNADTVVPQEDVTLRDGFLFLKKEIQQGANIRKKGTQTKKGNLALKKHTKITAEIIGFLATLGIHELPVFSKPKVGIIVTGKELVPLGKELKSYQIYESNSVFLRAALQTLDIETSFSFWADDEAVSLKMMVAEHAKNVDVLLFTGGISVGDYDFIKPVLEQLGVREYFYKIKQKPGKPFYFGFLDKTTVFALPGNPAAVATCFHIYVKPYLSLMMGVAKTKKEQAILLNEYRKKAGLTHFVKAFAENNKVEILQNQSSYQMDSFSKANALAVLREEQDYFQIGENIEIIKL
ncbi:MULTISPECIES: gephyrin-like molybdotransferase Glp [Sphingobacterium]|uniref:molybdopterin molybdotransferase MoeA n=1 Tax=Sphingobacterium TaxID=28453 RepID=UPI0013DA33F5|nr:MULTISPECIES: gephyrin-like molybdotransferase Glp [unclassified Sphingobacterium]